MFVEVISSFDFYLYFLDIGHDNTKDYEKFDLELDVLSASDVADALWDKIAAGIHKNVA